MQKCTFLVGDKHPQREILKEMGDASVSSNLDEMAKWWPLCILSQIEVLNEKSYFGVKSKILMLDVNFFFFKPSY